MADAGQIYAEMGQHLAEHITKAGDAYHKESGSLEEIQQYLNMARGIQTQDFKTGKPKNFFSDQQIQDIQRLIDLRKIKAAGAAEGALGIGKGMVDKIQGGAAREALARQGPITSTVNGVHFVFNPKTLAWQQITAVPRNEIGMTATSQIAAQQRAANAQAKAMQAQNKGFDALLGKAGLDRARLFDPSAQETGTFDPQSGFAATSQFQPPPTVAGQADPGTKPPDPTHVRVGYEPPDKNGKGGNPGVVVSTPELQSYQDTAAALAGPQAAQALQWLRQHPDDPLAPDVAKKFRSLVANPEAKPSQSPSATTAPDRGPTTIQGQPAFNAPPADTSADTSEDDGSDSEDQ